MVFSVVVINILFCFNILLYVIFFSVFNVFFFFGDGLVFNLISFEINYLYL